MSNVETIFMRFKTADIIDAGTDLEVYVGIGGREFYIESQRDFDDFERGDDRTYIIDNEPKKKDQDNDSNDEDKELPDEDKEDCDDSYPDFCIPSPPPDLDCSDVKEKNFEVKVSDPHDFDREGDGVGCES